MMDKRQPEVCRGSPDAGSGSGKREDSSIISRQNGCKEEEEPRREEGEKERGGRFKGAEETDDAPLQNSSNGTSISIIINGVAKETASHNALDLKREVPVIELSRRDAIKAVEQRTESHLVPITELRRPPLPLPPPQRDDARMVQLSPNAFPVPARAMLYNLAQPLAAINSLGGESEQYSMYPSNRVKRRPAPYEVELDEASALSSKIHGCMEDNVVTSFFRIVEILSPGKCLSKLKMCIFSLASSSSTFVIILYNLFSSLVCHLCYYPHQCLLTLLSICLSFPFHLCASWPAKNRTSYLHQQSRTLAAAECKRGVCGASKTHSHSPSRQEAEQERDPAARYEVHQLSLQPPGGPGWREECWQHN
ncbi:T-cell acute lymphocytic leukemia protein 1 homolog isoform X4 [Antennarius striatus]|uniref:T-cell acute lymphocytic leukemia protein 1 homolog isoform X4 n=1 Tax=Antennarius striatus TaxID=241820 RepID=UPI0035B0CA16